MHLLLTDRLTCPRCGPRFGLILRADELEDRRIVTGVLGCPNCREAYPVEDGIGDLRPEPREPLPRRPDPEPASHGAVDAAQALLGLGGEIGLTPGVAQVVLTEGVASLAPGLTERLEDLEIVVVSTGSAESGSAESGGSAADPAGNSAATPSHETWSRIVSAGVLPLHEASVRGVVIHGSEADRWVASAVRVVAPRSRIVVLEPEESVAERLETAGLVLRLDAAEAVVAERSPAAPTRSPGVAPFSGAR